MGKPPPLESNELIARLTLKLIPELGNRSLLRLMKHFGSARAILSATPAELEEVHGLREKARLALLGRELIRPVDEEWRELRERGIKLLCLDQPEYPSNLAAIPDPPVVLFVSGTLEARDLVSVAVVGSRAASPMGVGFTERLCADLAGYGVTIVSGFAVGIDAAAHRGALKGGGRTIGVLGCGLDVPYPKVNEKLRADIAGCGALVSEFPLGTPPAPGHFPQRNRIISGLALGVVVVEAAQKSGSLITAGFALEQGREVFAVPGMARHFRSVGPHRLLKEGAKLVECAEDVMEEIRPLVRPSWKSGREDCSSAPGPDLTQEEAAILNVLDATPRHIDDICRSTGRAMSQVMSGLLSLELKGVVQQLPGKYFTYNRVKSH